MLEVTKLKAISPLDGRYRDSVEPLAEYLSESALIFYRLEVEIKYLEALSKAGIIRKLSKSEILELNKIFENKSDENAIKIKHYEDEVKHDVKSVELFLREVFKGKSVENIIEKLHYCLTSEDVNNIAYRLMIINALCNLILPAIKDFILQLSKFADQNKNMVMMARTHGQDAIPTTLGKEMSVFAVRLADVYKKIKEFKLTGKLNGAIGGWNSHVFAESKLDWMKFSKNFVESFRLKYNEFTSQINPYDDIVELLSLFHLFNSILLDFNQDMWRYISDGWLIQKVDKNQVGSSTMAQKVNPINFENSEGNIQVANGLIESLSRILPVSRLQRDLSNSTVIRNVSTIFAHEVLIVNGASSGLSKVSPDKEEIADYLNSNWSILAEPLQILLRKYDTQDAYNIVKEKTMGKKMNEKEWKKLIKSMKIKKSIINKALKISVNNYIGYCSNITHDAVKYINNILN